MPDDPVAGPASSRRSGWRHVFFGPVRLRAGWRLLGYVVVSTAFGAMLRAAALAARVSIPEEWTPGTFVLLESLSFVVTLAATLVMMRIDRLPLARFGFPVRDAFRARFWEGMTWGFVSVALLVGAIAALGGYHVRGLALHGGPLAGAAVLWLLAMVLVGLGEELAFRGYPLAALADGIGFWPAALLLSLDFAATHYFFKPMESLADALSVGLIGLFLCFTLRRTGNLWFAIGFHCAFDFAAIPLFGAPNTGNHGRPVATRILDGTFSGPDWLTGGVRGVEASGLVFVLIALLFALFHARFRAVRFPPPVG